MKLLPLDAPWAISLVAEWLSREQNYKWLDFRDGSKALTAVSLNVMTQRDLHVRRVFTPDDSDLLIGITGLSDVHRHWKMAGSVWAPHAPYRKLLTFGFVDLGLEQ